MARDVAILVSGGAGYIGAHCCKALSEAGYLPVSVDDLSTGSRDFVKWGPLVVASVLDTAQVAETIKSHHIAAVMHFAAFSQVGESVADPQKYYLNNVGGTLSLLAAMRETGCRRLVFSSTGAVYGNAGRDPIPEDAAGSPVNPYGVSKWMIEQILADFRAAYQLHSTCLRYFNASGAERSASIGEFRNPETHLIPRAMMALQGHVDDFAIFGDDYDTPDGTAVRDYIHVEDLAAAHIMALDALLNGSVGGCFNLGTGSGHSVREVIAAVEAAAGRKIPMAVKPRRPGDPPFLVADPSSARKSLGFRPVVSDLTAIVSSAWAWHQKAHPRR
jgi:UDP-glucose 4-epimerase/UDP-arabinose 4-epimerase